MSRPFEKLISWVISLSTVYHKEIFRNVDKDSYHILVLIAQKAKMNSVFNDQK